MKVYMIYKKMKALEPLFYAYTDEKELKDKFFEQRNKNKFFYFKQDMTKDEFKLFKCKYYKYSLSEVSFKTKDINSLNNKGYVPIVVTGNEEFNTLISNDDVILELAKFTNPDEGFILQDKYLNALIALRYFQFCKYKEEEELSFNPKSFNRKESNEYSYIINGINPFRKDSMEFDEYEVFMTKYKDTMKSNIS